METSQATPEIKNESTPKVREIEAPGQWLRKAAEHHDRAGQPVWALLYRNEAYFMEGGR